MLFYYINNSTMKTTTQASTDTGKSPAPSHARTIPAIKAINPETGLAVASNIDGKVMTASVTYGT